MKRLLTAVAALVLFFSFVLVLLALLIPKPDPMSVTLARDITPNGSTWCWRGLCLGQTLFEAAKEQLLKSPVFSDLPAPITSRESTISWAHTKIPLFELFTGIGKFGDSGTISTFEFEAPANGFTLADAILLFGPVRFVNLTQVPDDACRWVNLCFEQNICVSTIETTLKFDQINLRTNVLRVRYLGERGSSLNSIRWHGFRNYKFKEGEYYFYDCENSDAVECSSSTIIYPSDCETGTESTCP